MSEMSKRPDGRRQIRAEGEDNEEISIPGMVEWDGSHHALPVEKFPHHSPICPASRVSRS